jgi:ADP-ribosylglycohydrolase
VLYFFPEESFRNSIIQVKALATNWKFTDSGILSRAQGCLLGQLAGDALGSLVEFRTPEAIRRRYPGGVRKLADGGTFNTIAGQQTDDSEMALMLARMLVDQGTYDSKKALEAYKYCFNSGPFDCGSTVATGLLGWPNPDSQANGALMRISPLGIFGANYDLSQIAEWAQQDAALTHPHPVCRQANALFAMAIAHVIRTGIGPQDLYQQILAWAEEMKVDETLMQAITGAATAPPVDFMHHKGWVLIAFRNALWQLLHAPSLEEGVVEAVMRGGDTDTNAAICGALLGAVYGRDAIPRQWVESLLNCRPAAGKPNVNHPRPECFWPVDALELAERLVLPRHLVGDLKAKSKKGRLPPSLLRLSWHPLNKSVLTGSSRAFSDKSSGPDRYLPTILPFNQQTLSENAISFRRLIDFQAIQSRGHYQPAKEGVIDEGGFEVLEENVELEH